MDAGMVTILVTLIGEAAGIIGILIKTAAERKKNAIEQARRDQKLDDRLDRLEKKVDEHNGYAQKFTESSKAIIAIQKDVEWLKKK